MTPTDPPEAHADATPTPPARRLPGPGALWPVACLFLLGLLIGSHWTRPGPGRSDPAPRPGVAAPGPADDPAVDAMPAAERARRAAALLAEADYAAALRLYESLPPGDPAAEDPAWVYGRAVCLEAAGRLPEALAAYRALVRPDAAAPAVAAAQVGVARVWLRSGRTDEALTLLSPLRLRLDQKTAGNADVPADAAYLLAVGLALRASGGGAVTVAGEPLVTFPPGRMPVCPRPGALTGAAPAPGYPPQTLEVVPVGRDPAAFLVRCACRDIPFGELADKLAAAAGTRAAWTEAARERGRGRRVAAAAEGVPLATFLTALGESAGLVARAAPDGLSLSAREELPPAELHGYDAAAALRALQDAVLDHPAHPLTPYACLLAGNLEAAAGRLPQAGVWYERLFLESPNSPVADQASYNLGLVYQALGQADDAEAAFYRVIDHIPGNPLAAPAYRQIGAVYLEAEQPERALLPFRRGLAVPAGTADRARLAVGLACAHLLLGDPGQARAALREHHRDLQGPAERPAAAFLDALARRRLADPRGGDAAAEDAELLAALIALDESPPDDTVLSLLRGRAYEGLGLPERAAAAYAAAGRGARGPLGESLAYSLASLHRGAGRADAAAGVLAGLAARPAGRWADRARADLAEMAYEAGRADECLRLCRGVVGSAGPEARARALRLMGRVYEQQGRLEDAARCYSGRPPEGEGG